MERQLYTAHLVRSISLSDRTKHLEFRVRELPRFDFTAGQFVSMKERHHEKEITRAYSIASPPRADNSFDLCLNRVDEGFFSNYLCDLQEGADVKFHGPHGYFVMKQPVRDSIFIATGTGIAPMRGMLQWLYADPARYQRDKYQGTTSAVPKGEPEELSSRASATERREGARSEGSEVAGEHQFCLVFGSRVPADIYYNDEFTRLAATHPNFHYVRTLSRAGPDWQGLRGYVQEHVREIARGRGAGSARPADAYICGLKNMVNANRDLLVKELGWDKKSVLYERFD